MDDRLALIELEIPRLRRYARYLAGNVEKSDDLVQEALTRAIEKLDTWQPGTNLRAWLFVILRNVFINEHRREKHGPVIGELKPHDPRLAVAGGQEAHMALLELQDAFQQLPDTHREVLILVVMEGLQYEEAAAILDVPVGTVRSRLSRARGTLKDLLNPASDEREEVAL